MPVPLVRQAALTTTKVPWFNGSTSWEQYQQVFDAIVSSNGWGDATAALQLLSHLQDDALSVALLIPMPLQASRKELTDALSSHYGSPGRLANYRREFDKTVRKRGEDPSNFAITLESLAVKAFGNMGQTARLRLIRDRFITVMRVVTYDVIWIVCHLIRLSGILWIDVEYGRVMQILRCDESVNQCRNRFIRLTWLSSQTMKLNRCVWLQ